MMSLMKSVFFNVTARLVLLSAIPLVAIPSIPSQAQLRPQSQAEGQAQGGQGHAQAQNGGNAHTQAPPYKWPYFKPLPVEPAFSLYDALGRPDNFKISGTFRPRVEGISNQFRPATFPSHDFMVSSQTAIFAEYDAGRVRIGGEVFDSRAYFQKPNSSAANTEVNALELGQAYLNFDLSDVTGEGSTSSLTTGRFTKNMSSRRILARNQYRNTINAFTGVSYDWKGANKDKMTLLWTMPHSRFPNDTQGILDNAIVYDRESLDLQFYGGTYTFENVFGGSLEVYGYGLYEKDSGTGLRLVQTRNRRLFTPGIRLARVPKPGQLDYDVEAIYQTGLSRETTAPTDTRDLQVSAYFLHAEAGYTFNAAWLPRVVLQYDHASGNSTNPSTFTRFDTLFGARRWEYGPTGLYGVPQRSNMISPSLRLEITPSPIWDAFIAYRPLFLESPTDAFAATQIRDRSGQSGRFAGQQIETRLRTWIIPDAMLIDTGVAYLIKGRFLRDAPNAPDTADTFYGYFSTTFFF